MAGIPKEHNELYFDKLCRTQKSETVLSLIQATYHAKRNLKNGENARDAIAKRLVSAYELFKDNPKGTDTGAGTYTGDYKQFESQYTIGHELCIWKNSNLDLTELALKVAKNEITIKDYFDVFFLNYFQPIDGKAIHILYSILSYMIKINNNEMDKKDIHVALGVNCNNESINALCNFLEGTSYIDYKNDKLLYVGKEPINELLSKCNTKYIGANGLNLARQELDNDEKYAAYITSGYVQTTDVNQVEYAWYVGTTGHDENGVWRDFSDEFIEKGIWKNGYTDKFLDEVKTIKVGDKIVIKAKYNQKNNLPFNGFGKKVGAMRLKAIGTVIDNMGDGRNLKVEWKKIDPNKVWYGPGTLWATIYLVKASDGFIKKSLLDFTFANKAQDYTICEDYYNDAEVDTTVEEEKEEYTIDQLGSILHQMSSEYEQVLAIHLFGIRYGQYIREKNYSVKDIISKAGLPESYFAELNKGIKLSNYVDEIGEKEIIDTYIEEEEKIDYDTCSRLHTGTNIILYGVPGAGKSWTIKNEYCDDETRMERLVFHPDYTYSDFVGQILPHIDEDGSVSYEFTPGPFTNLVKKAYRNPLQEYYLVIEEVNRGNAPAIFGDVFQLLDRDGREKVKSKDGSLIDNIKYRGSEYEITNNDIAKVVYEDENHKVTIPSNMHILCTMNTSDQNVFTLDTAFQRRWSMRLIKNKFREEASEKVFAGTKILDTSVTWDTFFTEINKIILSKNIRMTSSEDKRLGTHFVSEEDLKYIEGDEKQNSRFPEKVLKYLWDDAFKFTKEDIFDLTKVKSLEDVIDIFTTSKKDERFKVFKENIYKTFLKQDTNE